MENQTKPIEIPNLGGLITEDDLYYKGKVPYCSWAKTAQRIREHAPNWFFALEPDPNGQIVWMAPDNTGYLMGYFQNVETGIKLPLYVYSITNNFKKVFNTIKSQQLIFKKRIEDVFALAPVILLAMLTNYGRVLKLKMQRKKKKPKSRQKKDGVTKTPTKPNQEPDKDYLIPKAINPEARDLICQDIRDSGHQEQILKDFKEHFKLKVKQVRPENITLSEHGRFLRQAVEKYKDD